ncbi:MAG: alkaline phosphatase D family protein [Hyphomonadaceae bacterium]|nr:alkaline phosphatase D family protein [Hyphomonadaceae bacterium]
MVHASRRAVLGAAPLLLVAPAQAQTRPMGQFTHGVASGDPTAGSVILWTRFAPATPGSATIGWEVADDAAFRRVRARGSATASVFDDYCVKVDATGLAPGRPYYYRFLAADGPSPTGLTRTAPSGDAASLTLALFSCSNLPFGYFHAYAQAAAREDVDLCVHTGDYIYEYPRGQYPSAEQAVAGRVIEPATEIVRLSDYHARYASYRADPALQEVHRTKPFVTIWDDHELTNDAWRDGAQNHQPDTEGDWTVRRAIAAKAYADWMPIRRQDSLLRIYRRVDWGTLATILLLDTRLIGRDKQLDWRTALAPAMAEGGAALAKAARDYGEGPLKDEKRTLLGAEQEAWMRAEMRRSKGRGATWQVLAQQLVTGKQAMAPELPRFLPADASANSQQFANAGAMLGQMGYGWNLDSWGGYPAARDRFLQSCAMDGSNALVLSGDSHNAWAFNLPGGKDGRPAAVEVAGASVTSPGFENTFRNAPEGGRESAMTGANKELAWCDLSRRGYAVARLTRAAVDVEWIAFDDVRVATAPTPKITRSRAEATRTQGVGPWTFSG